VRDGIGGLISRDARLRIVEAASPPVTSAAHPDGGGVVGAGGEGLELCGPAIRNLPAAERAIPGSGAEVITVQARAGPRPSGTTSAGG
jgi:hypothetical protein